MYFGMAARGTTRSMMSSMPLALPTKNNFSRALMSWVAACDGRTYTSMAPSSSSSPPSAATSSSRRAACVLSSTMTR